MSLSKRNVKLNQKKSHLQGFTKCVGYTLDIPNATLNHSIDITFDYDIELYFGSYFDGVDHVGNKIIMEVNPNTVIGFVTAPVNIGDTVINVNDTVIDNIIIGSTINIGEDLGICVSKDEANNQITVKNPSLSSYAAGTLVDMTISIADINLSGSNTHVKVEAGLNTMSVKKGYVIRLKYFNNTGISSKKFDFQLSYDY